MNTARWILSAAACATVALVSPAFAQVQDDAKAVLTESADAIRNTPSLSFKSKRSATGILKDIIDADGSVKILRGKPGTPPLVLLNGRVKQPGQADKQLTMRQDGKTLQWLSAKDNKLMIRPAADQASTQEISFADQILVKEFLSNEPYAKELQSAKLTKTGIDNVGGEVCDIVVASSADGMRNTTWAISVNDRLPRRVEMANGGGEQKIAMITEMTEVKTDAALSEKDFAIALPAGYVKDEVAPQAAAVIADAVAEPMGLEIGSAAPAFTGKDSAGKDVSLAGMKDKVVVLEFFGTKFTDSTERTPEVQQIADGFKSRGVEVVGLACREDSDQAPVEHFRAAGATYTLVPKADAACEDFKVVGFPTYYVLGRDGKVAAFFQGWPGKDPMTQAIEAAVAGNGKQ